MKCYYHPQADAVGICKSCSKGICPECTTDVGGNGLACKGIHEAEVASVNEIIGKNKTAFQTTGRAMQRSGIIYGITATLLLLVGLLLLAAGLDTGTASWTAIGAGFLAGSIILYAFTVIQVAAGRKFSRESTHT